MLRSYRLLIAAAIGLAILNPINERAYAQDGTKQSQPKAEQNLAQPKPVDLTPIQKGIEGVAGAIQSLKDKPESAEERDRANRDLKAQEDMALWAKWMFYASCASLVVGVGGLIVVFRTLRHSEASTNAALAGLDQTGQSIELNKQTAERQLRAYVSAFPHFIHSFSVDGRPTGKFIIKNVGVTPANGVNHRGDVIVVPEPLPDGYRLPRLNDNTTAPAVLFPNMPLEGSVVARTAITEADIVKIRNGTARIYIHGELYYTDAFSPEERVTKFCAFVAADAATLIKLTRSHAPADLKIGFTAAPFGNSAT